MHGPASFACFPLLACLHGPRERERERQREEGIIECIIQCNKIRRERKKQRKFKPSLWRPQLLSGFVWPMSYSLSGIHTVGLARVLTFPCCQFCLKRSQDLGSSHFWFKIPRKHFCNPFLEFL